MHLSMHNWMRSEPIEVTVARLARYGYGSIEIKGEPDQYDTADVRKLLADNGLNCWGAVTLTLAERNLCAKDEQQRAASVQYMKDVVTMVKELEGQEITIVPSTVGKIVPDGTPEQEWEWCVAGLQEIREHANGAGVRIAIEPLNRFETHFVNRGEQALALADAVGPDVGVCLDCFHMNIEEVDLLETIRAIGPRLTDFHVADNNRLACGMGALDWPAIVSTLKEVGYDGALTVEFVAPIDRTPANRYPDALETNPVDISPEELQFIIDHGSSLLSEGFYSMLVEQCATTLLPLIWCVATPVGGCSKGGAPRPPLRLRSDPASPVRPGTLLVRPKAACFELARVERASAASERTRANREDPSRRGAVVALPDRARTSACLRLRANRQLRHGVGASRGRRRLGRVG